MKVNDFEILLIYVRFHISMFKNWYLMPCLKKK